MRDDLRMVVLSPVRCAPFALAAIVFCGLAHAGPVEVFRSGEVERNDAERSIAVRSGLVQIEIAPGMVLSAGAGTEFLLDENGGTLELAVRAGSARVVLADARYELGEGRYRLQPGAGAPVVAFESASTKPDARALAELPYRHSVHLADSVMLRQEKLLHVNTRDFVRGVLSLFRR